MPPAPSAKSSTFYWHDYETSGTDSRRDRPVQFAGQRTTLDLEPVGEPLSLYCKPAPDVLPQPAACLITGITPQHAQREGVIEAEFAAQVHQELAQPGTCGAGYNSLRFDDEFTRQLLYRNFYDAYEREWSHGNSRWDIIDLARLCYALRPQGLQWPQREDGSASFRLEDLTAANGLAHAQAHDALSDVNATIALARLLRAAQPRLWNFYLALRHKQRAFELLDYVHCKPVLHVSSRYPAARGCLAIVVPLALQPDRPNSVIVYDLAVDPRPLLELDAQDIADRLFTPQADLPEDVTRIPLKIVHANKSPALAPLSALSGVDTARIALDFDQAMAHLQLIHNAPDLAEKLRRVYSTNRDPAGLADPELALYGGFLPNADKPLLTKVRSTPPEQLAAFAPDFRDPRYPTLLLRYRARNWPQTLAADELETWNAFRRTRLTESTSLTSVTLGDYFAQITLARVNPQVTGAQHSLLDQLEHWARGVAAELESNR
jgi:exodeoxyribonuclease-1